MTVILQPPAQLWECPNCSVTDRTTGQPNRFHHCSGLAGLLAPMIPAGSGAVVVANEREDYLGREDVPTDADGRPIMSVTTLRPDGSSDVVAFAPTAYVQGEC